MTAYPVLTITTFLPLAGAVLLLALGSERLARWISLAATLATEIKGNAAIAFLECRDLGIEHSAAPEQPVSKDDRLQPAAMLFIKEASAVD